MPAHALLSPTPPLLTPSPSAARTLSAAHTLSTARTLSAAQVIFLLSHTHRANATPSTNAAPAPCHRRRRGRDPLAEAYRNGHTAVVDVLLAQPPSAPTSEDVRTWSRLRTAGRWLGRAACLDSVEHVRTWLAFTEGADEAATFAKRAPVLEYAGSDQFSALHFAARHGSVGVAAILLRAGADAFATDSYGRCPQVCDLPPTSFDPTPSFSFATDLAWALCPQHYALLYHHDSILQVLPPLDDETLERLHLTRRALAGGDDSDDEEGPIYTFDMWDAWYEEHGWPTDGAPPTAARPAIDIADEAGEGDEAATVPPLIRRQLTSEDERRLSEEHERWRRLSALVVMDDVVMDGIPRHAPQGGEEPLRPTRQRTCPF